MLKTGYLVMDYIGNSDVQMLSETWDEHRHQRDKRTNLFKGLSRIMLSLSRVPLPRIGSWTLDSNGALRLSNRPLTLRLHQLENSGISTNVSRSLTYSVADAYYLDLLSCHDSRIRNQPNSVSDADDGRAQMARLTMMKALLPHFSKREHREGPFFYRLTDLHPSSIFVDSQWNVKFVIDLEWACSLPAETLRPPYWLTGRSVDDLTGEHLGEFREAYEEFVDIFEEEEKLFPPINNVYSYRTTLMRNGWQVGNFWYFHALDSPKGLFNLFRQNVYPIFAPSHQVAAEFSRLVSEKVVSGNLSLLFRYATEAEATKTYNQWINYLSARAIYIRIVSKNAAVQGIEKHTLSGTKGIRDIQQRRTGFKPQQYTDKSNIGSLLTCRTFSSPLVTCEINERVYADSDHYLIRTLLDIITKIPKTQRQKNWKTCSVKDLQSFVDLNLQSKAFPLQAKQHIELAIEYFIETVNQGIAASTLWAKLSKWTNPSFNAECREMVKITRKFRHKYTESIIANGLTDLTTGFQ
ncbi:uncharacterized protein KD926_005031 [Aspergillus affinis]|uniref:uncharacterized protein n=1 Tax=Aspergillus affinis TaxID=1070780 RepID=UPI0022FE5E69|nr:uncharacterized protein KD926_005031 [Aspergillus affinis]KAI9034908.1 hypothetical protein KD926_005031 [Aspergillus affinis]